MTIPSTVPPKASDSQTPITSEDDALSGLERMSLAGKPDVSYPHWQHRVRMALLCALGVLIFLLGGVIGSYVPWARTSAVTAPHLMPHQSSAAVGAGTPTAPTSACGQFLDTQSRSTRPQPPAERTVRTPYLEGVVTVTNLSGHAIFDGCLRLIASLPTFGAIACANAPFGEGDWYVHILPQDARPVVTGTAKSSLQLHCLITGLPSSAQIPPHTFAGAWPAQWPTWTDATVVHLDNAASFRWVRA